MFDAISQRKPLLRWISGLLVLAVSLATLSGCGATSSLQKTTYYNVKNSKDRVEYRNAENDPIFYIQYSRDGNKIVKQNFSSADGISCGYLEYEYDADGQIQSSIYYGSDGKKCCENKYNENQKVTQRAVYDENEDLCYTEYYDYYQSGELSSYDAIDPNNKILSQERYDTKGNLIKSSSYTEMHIPALLSDVPIYHGYEYGYDENGNMTRETLYDDTGIYACIKDMEYDDAGNLIREQSKYHDRYIPAVTNIALFSTSRTYSYDSDGKLIEKNGYDYYGNSVYSNSYYYEGDLLKRETDLLSGSESDYMYDRNGKVTEVKTKENNFEPSITTYEYEKRKNVWKVTEHETEEGEDTVVSERYILDNGENSFRLDDIYEEVDPIRMIYPITYYGDNRQKLFSYNTIYDYVVDSRIELEKYSNTRTDVYAWRKILIKDIFGNEIIKMTGTSDALEAYGVRNIKHRGISPNVDYIFSSLYAINIVDDSIEDSVNN